MVRIKHRYLLVNFLYPADSPNQVSTSKSATPAYLPFLAPSPSSLTPVSLLRHLRASVATNFGDYGHGLTAPNLRIIYLSNATSTAIVRCPRAHFRLVWASLTLMDALPTPDARKGDAGKKCVVRVVRVSGTVKKAEEEVVRRAKQEMARARAMMGGVGALDAMMDSRQGITGPATKSGEVDDEELGIEDDDGDEDVDDASE